MQAPGATTGRDRPFSLQTTAVAPLQAPHFEYMSSFRRRRRRLRRGESQAASAAVARTCPIDMLVLHGARHRSRVCGHSHEHEVELGQQEADRVVHESMFPISIRVTKVTLAQCARAVPPWKGDAVSPLWWFVLSRDTP